MALVSGVSMQRKSRSLFAVAVFLAILMYIAFYDSEYSIDHGFPFRRRPSPAVASAEPVEFKASTFRWAHRPPRFPVTESELSRMPKGKPKHMPKIQFDFNKREKQQKKAGESGNDRKAVRNARRDTVRRTFRKSWDSYRQYAWGADELLPLTRTGTDSFGGWGATLVDALDTLWMMDLKYEFDEAVRAVAAINWDESTSPNCNTFETNIRYLGGLLSAYDLSGVSALRVKALELAYMLLAAFDTKNHMPTNQLAFERAWEGELVASSHEAAAVAGSFSLEFTRVARMTGDMRFYDAIDRVKTQLAGVQNHTNIPGLWPTILDLQKDGHIETQGSTFSLGALADSMYEYLPKMHMMLGGLDDAYKNMYTLAADTARAHLLFRPMVPNPEDQKNDILVSGKAVATRHSTRYEAEGQHLTCFAGGMFALGGRLFDRPADVEAGLQLTRGCIWAYDAFPTGVMPEVFDLVACPASPGDPHGRDRGRFGAHREMCAWDDAVWEKARTGLVASKLHECPKGFAAVRDARYLLRPEAVESVFVLYRITGDESLLDAAWDMFLAIQRSTSTRHGNAAIEDVTVKEPKKMDKMESFWFAETLKYLYLTFSEPDFFSLDDYVFNTEAHPFAVPKP